MEIKIRKYNSRESLWIDILNQTKVKDLLEIGVYKGEFTEVILNNCEAIENYLMIDPWMQLNNWDKPLNVDNSILQSAYLEAIQRTKRFGKKVQVIRGTTVDVIDNVEDNLLDFVYIDGDHTLRGITIDLISAWKKVKKGGMIGGDDLTQNLWQHGPQHEPTLVFPYALYFAEAMKSTIFLLPFNQFLIFKNEDKYEFVDYTGTYQFFGLKKLIPKERTLKQALIDRILKCFRG